MANYAKIEFTFISSPSLDSVISFVHFNAASLEVIYPSETAKTIRSAVGQYSIGSISSEDEAAYGFSAAMMDDFGFRYNISVSVSPGNDSIVTIEAKDYNVNFTDIITPIQVDYVYTSPVLPDTKFEITNVTAQQADTADRNTHARFNLTTQYGASPYGINKPVLKFAATEADLFFDYLRQPPLPLVGLSLTNNTPDTATADMPTVDFWTLDSLTVNEAFGSATVIANTTTQSGTISVTKEYSLDQIDWYLSSSFTGVLPGSYTLYARDNLGALRSDTFTVVGITIDKPDPFFKIQKANSLRFVPVTNFNDCSNIANWDNALFSELNEQGKWPNVEWQPYNQLIADCDVILNQIQTNYDNIVITVTNCEGDEFSIVPDLKVKNILLEDMRDCSFRPISNHGQESDGKTLLYFTGGNVYDPETEISDGTEYYNPTKGIYPFAKTGNLFTISGTTLLNGEYTQLGVLKDQDTGYWGVVLDLPFTGSDPTTGTIKINYNELDYNIWEFSVVGAALNLNNIYKISISATDDDINYPDVFWHSEPIKKVITDRTTVMDYSNDENTADLDFSTGSIFRLRLESRFIDGTISEDTGDFQTDYGKKVILKTVIKESFNFEGMLYPFYLVRKISFASGMSNLLINNVKFVKGEELEIESKIKENNPFQIVNRSYQHDSQSITTHSGLVTQSKQVIGSGTYIAIGDNN